MRRYKVVKGALHDNLSFNGVNYPWCRERELRKRCWYDGIVFDLQSNLCTYFRMHAGSLGICEESSLQTAWRLAIGIPVRSGSGHRPRRSALERSGTTSGAHLNVR